MNQTVSRIDIKNKIGFGLGDLGFNIGVQATALVLMKFYTDTLLIGAGMAGIVVLVSKIIDAITDPLMGVITDRTESRWGKFRPYLLIGAIPFGLSFFLLLNAPVSWSLNARIIYAFITYIFFCIMLTVTNVPYQSLLSVMTRNSDERVALSSFRSVGGIIGVLIAAVAIESIVASFGQGNDAAGYRIAGLITAAIIVITTLICFSTTRENYKAKKEKALTLKENVLLIIKNKPFVILWLSVLLIMIGVNTLAATVFFYFEYYLLNAGMGMVAFAACFLLAIISMPLYVKLSKTKSNKFSYILGNIIMCAGLLFIFIVGKSNIILSVTGMIIFGIGLSANYLCPWAMIANTIEYSQLKSGIRKEGTFYGVFFLVMKLSAALAGFLVGQILSFSKYVPNLLEQQDSALTAIRLLMTIIPIGLVLIGSIVLFSYSITTKSHKKMVEELRKMDA